MCLFCFFFKKLDPQPFQKAGVPPFGLHPHHGLQVSTLLWSGVMSSRLGHETEEEKTVFGKPGKESCIVAFAGRGLSHDEKTVTADFTEAQQLIWLIPEAARSKPAFFELLEDASWKTVAPGAEVIVWYVILHYFIFFFVQFQFFCKCGKSIRRGFKD
jgi:redox-sensitive bicupin YhaK (pirin superfamily)